MHNIVQRYAQIGVRMKARLSKKRDPFIVPEIVDGMCGLCQFWHRRDDDEYGECAVLAIRHQREVKVKMPLVIRDPEQMGVLQRRVYERTMAATDGYEWFEAGGGEVVPAEDFSSTPRDYIDLDGQKKKIWSPLRIGEWGTCSRYERSMVRRTQPVEELTTGQLFMFTHKEVS